MSCLLNLVVILVVLFAGCCTATKTEPVKNKKDGSNFQKLVVDLEKKLQQTTEDQKHHLDALQKSIDKLQAQVQVVQDENSKLGDSDLELKSTIKALQTENNKLRILDLGFERQFKALQDENNGLKDVIVGMGSRLKTQEHFAEVVSSPVAFSATLTQPNHYYEIQDTVVFDEVFTNAGNAYNSASGIFTCPHKALYLVTVTIRSTIEGALVALYMDEEEVGRLHAQGRAGEHNIYGTSTNTFILNCKENSKVKIASFSNATIRVYGNYYSTFSAIQVSF